METTLAQIAALLTAPPGNLVYHLVIAFSIAGALSTSLFQAPASLSRVTRRLILGMAVLLFFQVVLFLANGIAGQTYAPIHYLLPTIDRAVSLLSLFILIWVWVYLFYLRNEKYRVILISAGIFVGCVATLLLAPALPRIPFNLTWLDAVWQSGMVCVCLLGIWLVSSWKPPLWAIGTVMFSLLAAGHLAQLVFRLPEGDFPGLSRLADLAAFPFLMALPGRHQYSSQFNTRPNPFSQERRRHSTDPATMRAFLDLASPSANVRPEVISRAIAHAMIADCCFLVTPYDPAGQVTFLGGYDLIQDISLPGLTLDATRIPSFAAALRTGKPLIENPEDGEPEPYREIGIAAHFAHTGSLIFYPIFSAPEEPKGGILLLSPYSNREWTTEDQAYLAPAAAALAQMVVGEENRPPKTGAQIEVETPLPPAVDLVAIRSLQQELQETIERLQAENEAMRAAGQGAQLQPQPPYPDGSAASPLVLREAVAEEEYFKLINSLVIQIRQSITAAAGYSDLLTAPPASSGSSDDSIKLHLTHSLETTRFLLDGISHLLALHAGPETASAGWIDLPRLFDQGIAFIQSSLVEKELVVQVDLPAALPSFQADESALRQVLIHLLKNAASVSSNCTGISISARLQVEEAIIPILILQVTDRGGGIPSKDLHRVFSPLEDDSYRHIPGVADERVGLQLARALVQALGGRIWIEALGEASTFSVLLPVICSTPYPVSFGP